MSRLYPDTPQLRRLAIKRALRKPCPLGGRYNEYNANENDCASVLLRFKEKTPDLFRVIDLHNADFSGVWVADFDHSDVERLAISELDQRPLYITEFFGHVRTTYTSPSEYLLKSLFGFTKIIWAREELQQRAYNLRTRFRTDRYDVLREIVGIHLKDSESEGAFFFEPIAYDELDLFVKLYGDRAFGHPNHEREVEVFRLILRGLVHNGDLHESEGKFRLTGKAINSLAEHEQQQIRFTQSHNLNKLLVILTAVLAIAAITDLLK
jgi:hypothetical protein